MILLGIIWTKLEQAKEASRLVLEGKAKTVQEALEIVKSHSDTDQSNQNDYMKINSESL